MSNKVPQYIKREIAYRELFKQDAKVPETEIEIKDWFVKLACDLSPENLTCDGELSKSAVKEKYTSIMEAWKWLETKLGRKVSEEDAYNFESEVKLHRKTKVQ
jgi:hypothetical protein